MKTSPMRISRLRRDSARCARLFDRLRSFPTCSAHIHRLGVRLQHRIDDWPRLFDIVFGGTKRKDAPGSESKVISLEERAKVTEALKAILDEGGSRLSATDIVRIESRMGDPVLRSRINPSSPRNLSYPYNFLQTEE
jgi:hypothetical protein